MRIVHKILMESFSLGVDCGIHYIHIMYQMTRSNPAQVSTIMTHRTYEFQKRTTVMVNRNFDLQMVPQVGIKLDDVQ
jgi:hypothetical protein